MKKSNKKVRPKKRFKKTRKLKRTKIKKRRITAKRKIIARKKPKKRIKMAKKRIVKRIKKRAKKRVIKQKKKIRTVKKKVVRSKRKKQKKQIRKYSAESPLEQLFESPAKVQVMKLFFRNPEKSFLLKEAVRAMRINFAIAKKQMKKLEKIGFLKTRQISSHKQLFSLNPNFNFLNELKELILRACPVSKERLLKNARGLGKIKLILLSGLFMGNESS